MKTLVRTLVVLAVCVACSLAVWGAVKSGAVSALLPTGPDGREMRLAGQPAASDDAPPADIQPGERVRPGRGQLPSGGRGGHEGNANVNIGSQTWRTLGQNLGQIALLIFAIGTVRWAWGRISRSKTRPAAGVGAS